MQRKSTIAWAQKHARLDYGAFDPDRLPFIREPLDTIDRVRGAKFILRGSIQSVKTLALQLRAVRSMQVEPVRSLWYSQQDDAVRDFADEKLNPLFDSCAPLGHLLYRDPNKRAKTRYILPAAPFFLLSANVILNRNSKSGQDLYLDEPWTYKPGQPTEIFGRASSYEWHHRIILAESGPDKGSETDQLWQASDRREWHVTLPCGHLQALEWGDAEVSHGMKWDHSLKDDRGQWDFAAVRATVRYVCSACGTSHEYSPRLQAEANRLGRYVQTNPAPDTALYGWHWNALAHMSWPNLVVLWLQANEAKRLGDLSLVEDFKRKRLAVAWDPADVVRYDRKIPFGRYKIAEDWPDEVKDSEGRPFRFLTVDVQKDHFWAVIRMWSHSGRSRLRWAGRLLTAGQIHDLQVEHDIMHYRVFLDSAYNPEMVYRVCSQFRWLCFNGTGSRDFLHPEDRIRRIYSPIHTIDPFQGTVQEGQRAIGEFYFSSNGAKNRLDLLRTIAEDDGEALWTIAEDASADYLEQIDGEVKIRRLNPRGGFSYEWQTVGPNHLFDCEVAQVVAASMAGFIGAESYDIDDENQEKEAS